MKEKIDIKLKINFNKNMIFRIILNKKDDILSY
jgi:hypothetical protein